MSEKLSEEEITQRKAAGEGKRKEREEARAKAVVEVKVVEEVAVVEPCWCGVHHKEGSKVGEEHKSGPKEETPAAPVIPEGSCLLGDALIGQNFRYAGQVWKKINHGLVLNFQNGDDSTEPMANDTVIEPILPGHEVEPDN